MAAYYYLLSSLPMLQPDGEMPVTYEKFLQMCSESVKQPMYDLLRDLTVDSSRGKLLSKWSRFYNALSEELAYQRCARLGRPVKAGENRDPDMIKTVNDVMNEKNPLNAENMLLTLEMEKLDELLINHWFDESALIGYALKLRLLERRNVFDRESGKKEFGRILGSIRKKTDSMGLE